MHPFFCLSALFLSPRPPGGLLQILMGGWEIPLACVCTSYDVQSQLPIGIFVTLGYYPPVQTE